MTQPGTTSISAIVARASRVLAWALLPLAALGLLRLFPPLSLSTDPAVAVAWLVPGLSGLAALAGATAALVALPTALRAPGSARHVVDAAFAGALAAAAAAVALAGPDGSGAAPSFVLALGALAAAVPMVAAPLLGSRRISRGSLRVASVLAVFAWVEIGPAIGLLAPAPPDFLPGALLAAAAAIACLAALAAVPAGAMGRIGWSAGMGSAFLALAIARGGSADVVPGLAVLVAALVAATISQLPGVEARPAAGEAQAASTVAAAPAPTHAAEAFGVEDDEALRLARELRGTIAELLNARTTIDLQRRELDQLAEVDAATGVASRRSILARLGVEAAEARRYAHPVAVVLVSLDGLGAVNREHGFAIGDAVLRELALRLRVRIREADALGRLDGDTFLSILPHTDERGSTVFADAVRTRLTARPVDSAVGPIRLTVSIGITVLHPGASGMGDDELVLRAEEALGSAQAAGGNRIAFDRQHGLARLDERRVRREPDPEPEERGDSSA